MRRIVLFAILITLTTIRFTNGQDQEWQENRWWSEDMFFFEPQDPAIPRSAIWKLERDKSVDGVLTAASSNSVLLKSANNRLAGSYKDDRADATDNRSLFTGEIIPGATAVVTMRQDVGSQHTTIYTGRIVSDNKIAGTFLDNRGLAGDWTLTFVAERIVEPLSGKQRDKLWFESVLGVYGKAIRGDRHALVNVRPPRRNLWTDEIKEIVASQLSYGDVDYIGTAKLVIHESGVYTSKLSDGVQLRVNGKRIPAGDVELDRGLYDVEIYTNHWGQPYLTYAEAAVYKKGTDTRIPFVNSAADIEVFRSQEIAGRRVVEVCDYAAKPVEFD